MNDFDLDHILFKTDLKLIVVQRKKKNLAFQVQKFNVSTSKLIMSKI